MHNNTVTYNELSESDFIPNGWCSLERVEDNSEICFKLKLWEAQCNFSKDVLAYVQKLNYGVVGKNCFNNLLKAKYILEILNSISPKDLETTEINYNKLFKQLK